MYIYIVASRLRSKSTDSADWIINLSGIAQNTLELNRRIQFAHDLRG